MSKYEAKIDLAQPNHSHVQVIELVGQDKRVLDVGCWRGDIGRVLKTVGCTVAGVELDPEAAADAAAVLDDVKVANVDETPLSTLFDAESFDVVIFADVLEHLTDPEGALADSVTLLAPGGRVVISVPNVTHGALRLSLLQGRWDLREEGLLDRTHIHFFTRSGLFQLLESAGLQADELRGVLHDPLATEVELNTDAFPPGTIEWVRDQPDSLVYQFQVSASRVPAGREPVHAARLQSHANPDEVRQQDRFTDEAVDAAREALRTRDHIMGLQAEATTAREVTKRVEEARLRLRLQNEKLRKQLEDQRGQLAKQKARIQQLERQGFVGFMRRVKRRLS